MLSHQIIRFAFRALLTFSFANIAVGAPSTFVLAVSHGSERAQYEPKFETPESADSETATYKWNLNERDLPLLALMNDRLSPGLEQSLSYSTDQFQFLIFHSLNRDEEHGRYLMATLAGGNKGIHFIEFESIGDGTYLSLDGRGIQLKDRDSLKTVRTSDGSKFTFVRYPDGEFRCASISNSHGASLNLLYAANGLTLQGVVDSFGRTIRFNYDRTGLTSVTQTWMANSTGVAKIWPIGDEPQSLAAEPVRYSHSVSAKSLPNNALVREYNPQMASSDKGLAEIFGGSNAVAAGNGFEPAGLGASYPLYRGDIMGDDGRQRRGHLSYAMHLYGSADGTGDSPLYVPPGFTAHSGIPSPTDAVVTFYYPRLGNLTDITLAVFHVSDFQITYEGDRVRIGNLGGPGGLSEFYKHSHIEFYKGNTALPPSAARPGLRIDPSTIFSTKR